MGTHLTFSSWNDYLGLSALISRGLPRTEQRREDDIGGGKWSFRAPAPAEPQCKKAVETSRGQKSCAFCRNNREAAALYSSHQLKAADGRILCPVLRGYTCPLCGANGDQAHTLRYCPLRLLLTAPQTPWNGC
ncbi:nanos homolog 1 [Rhinophrynus dorsalis]